MDRLTELEVFTRIAEEQSLTRTAELQGMSVSGVSRHLSSLETRLGVRLVQRTTRRLSLTHEGQRFAESAREILDSLKDAEEAVNIDAVEPRGLLRVGSTLSFGLLHLKNVIRNYRARYPLVAVDLKVSNRYYDLVENGLDVAVRTKRVEEDSSITIRRLAETRRVLAASPDYLAKQGTPEHPDDLKNHDMLLYTLADDWERFHFVKGEEKADVAVTPVFACNDGQLIRSAALDHAGILAQPVYVIEEDLKAGRLVRVLDDWDLPRLTMNVAFPTRTLLPVRTRLFVNELVSYFQDNDFETRWTK
jgi:DNA-binding transcriptional LysR family regulator